MGEMKKGRLRRPADIEAAVLYEGPCPAFGQDDVIAFLNAAYADAGVAFRAGVGGPDTFAILSAAGTILISRNDEPLAAGGFEGALASPIAQMGEPGARDAVLSHRSNVFVTVSAEAPCVDQIAHQMGLLEKVGHPEISVERFDGLQTACRLVAAWLVSQRFAADRPSLIHWCQSNQVMSPARFTTMALEMPDPAMLVHPFLHGEKDARGGQLVGLTTYGASHVIEREIEWALTDAPIDYLLTRTFALVEYVWKHRGGELIEDGGTFGFSVEDVIHVRHIAPDADYPTGRLRLSLARGPDGAGDDMGPQGPGGATRKVRTMVDSIMATALSRLLGAKREPEAEPVVDTARLAARRRAMVTRQAD